ncbi:MAG TPA: hypothetical protein VJX69_11140 [Terriglobales bacterium]|nr:hypothetical protein [Terriglobales bacterium]
MHDQRICRFLISAALMLTPGAFASTLYVGTCHTPSYSTISAAVAAAPAGSTVDVCPGTYPEQVFITEQLTLQGITSSGGDRARIVVPSNPFGGATNWQFVTDPITSIQVAAQVYVNSPATTPVKITNLTIDGTGEAGATACNNTGWWYTTGIYSWSSVTINEVNTIGQGQTSCGIGIWAEQGNPAVPPSVNIEHSSVLNPSVLGIYLTGPSSGPPMSVSVTSNAVETDAPHPLSGSVALYVAGSTGKISSNTLLTAEVGIWDNLANSSSLTISSNTVVSTVPAGSGTSGILSNDGPYAGTDTYSDNKFVSFDDGVRFLNYFFPASITLTNNSFVNSQTAIYLGCNNVTLSGNTINNARLGFDQVPSGFSTTGKASFYNVDQFVGTACP